MDNATRERSKIFNDYEKHLLLELMKDLPIIFSKQRDGITLTKKEEAWSMITDKFNEDPNVHKRDSDALKNCIMNLT
jgi:hypothetical protein